MLVMRRGMVLPRKGGHFIFTGEMNLTGQKIHARD